MEKESAIIGEYIVEIGEKVTVYRIYDNGITLLREIASIRNFPYPSDWSRRRFENKLMDTLGNGCNSVKVGEYYLQRTPDRQINVYRTCFDTVQGLNEIAKSIGFPIDGQSDERTVARNIIEFSKNGINIKAK